MSDDKFKGYDFDGDDPFDDGPFNEGGLEETPEASAASPELGGNESAQPMMDEPTREERAAPAKKKSSGGIGEFIKENWIMGVGGVVVIVVGYYMYNMIFPSAPSRPQHRVEHRAPVNHGFGLTSHPVKLPGRPAAPAGTPKPVVAHAAPVDAVTVTRSDLKQMVDGFSKIVQDNSQQLSAQIQKIGSAEKSISNLSSKNSAAASAALSSQNKVLHRLSANIADLQAQLTSTNKNMETITKSIIRTQTQLRVLLAQKSQDKDRLSLRAVVPGRAWLVDQSGKTMTVAVGEKIKNYGTVEKVDSKNAQVIMSSGYVFN